MSQTVAGLGNVFIAGGSAQPWTINSQGWPGNVLLEPQPLNAGAAMSSQLGNISLNPDGTYSFVVSIVNNGPNNTYYSLQFSTS